MSRARRLKQQDLKPARAFEKEMFREDLRELIAKTPIRLTKELRPDMLCVCARAKDCRPEDNDFWDDPDNKSDPRDVQCFQCGEQVSMSKWMYERYKEMPVKPRVACSECMVTAIKSGVQPKSWGLPESTSELRGTSDA